MKNFMNLVSTGPERIGEPEGKIRGVSGVRVRYRNRVEFWWNRELVSHTRRAYLHASLHGYRILSDRSPRVRRTRVGVAVSYLPARENSNTNERVTQIRWKV